MTDLKRAVSAELAKAMDIEDKVVDTWKSTTEASPEGIHDILSDWYAGRIYLLVPQAAFDKMCGKI